MQQELQRVSQLLAKEKKQADKKLAGFLAGSKKAGMLTSRHVQPPQDVPVPTREPFM